MFETINKFQKLWRYSKRGKKRMVPGVILMILGSLIFATIPMIARNYIDGLSNTSGVYDFMITDLYYAIAGLAVMVTAWFVLYTTGKTIVVDETSGKRMRDDLAEKVSRISVATLEDRMPGDTTAIMANDVPVMVRAIHTDIPNFFVHLALLFFIVIMMFLLSIQLTAIYLLLLIVSYFVTRKLGVRMHRQMMIKQESMGRLSGYFSDAIMSHSMVKIYGLEDKVIESFDSIDDVHTGSYVRTSSAFSYVEPLSRIVDNIGYLVTAIIGSMMIIDGYMTFGAFFAFISYTIIIGRPLISFTDSINRLQSASVSYDRILEFLDEVEMPNESAYDDIDTDSAKGGIEFRDVSFTYPDGTKALRDVCFSIEPGSMISIVGVEGSGKSTLSDLLMGFRTASSGEVLLDGNDIAEIKRSKLRSVIGISSQDPYIFEGTILYNLSQTAEREDIIMMSKLTGFDSYVSKLPRGYDTIVGGRGHKLSSGEIQLLSITRLLLYDPKVMIFDESTSNMDQLTAITAFSSIRDHLKDKTLIVVDNTPLSVQYADKVVFLGKGTVIDAGTHSELMDRNPAYVDMYRNMVA
ncbi:MAG: ABC transporter ATP-binding protein [Candidatus Methanomethylophilaceae archaeon]|nr:ABC transporter ATP-binding protein [Candidatus Methanomethylophilaceae archaeon]